MRFHLGLCTDHRGNPQRALTRRPSKDFETSHCLKWGPFSANDVSRITHCVKGWGRQNVRDEKRRAFFAIRERSNLRSKMQLRQHLFLQWGFSANGQFPLESRQSFLFYDHKIINYYDTIVMFRLRVIFLLLFFSLVNVYCKWLVIEMNLFLPISATSC